MLKSLLKSKWFLMIIFILMLIEPSINAVLNFWLQKLFSSAEIGADKMLVLRLLTCGFLLWMLKRLISFSSDVLTSKFICNVKLELKDRVFSRLLKLNTSGISESSGEYISVFTNDITLLETRLFHQIINFVSAILSVLILGSSFIALNTKVAISILAFGIITMFVPVVFSKFLNEKNLKYSKSISEFTQRIKEYTLAFSTIKNYAIEDEISKKFFVANRDAENSKFDADYSLSIANSIGSLLSWFMQFLAVGIGLILVIKGEIVIGTVISAQAFAGDIASPFQRIVSSVNSIRSIKSITNKLKTYSEGNGSPSLSSDPYVNNDLSTKHYTVKDCCIEFKDVCLEIGCNKLIDHFSFKFEQGKKYLVIGMNGSGKSSLFKSLKKWFQLCKGVITINNQDIESFDNEELSKTVSYMNEQVSLFSGTVRDNIILDRTYTESDFEKAISDACVTLNLDKTINGDARNISSGEQRRIEVARSLLNSSQVLIFDEVVSTLDIETAYEIEKLALTLPQTVIFVSHNFSGKLIKEYDEILIMDQGKLVANGSYEELIKHCSYFSRICNIKFGD